MRVSAPPRGHLGCLGSGGWPWPRIVRRRDKGQTKSHTPHSGRASSAGLSFAVRRVSFLCKSPGREGRISVFVGEAGGVEKKKREKAQNPTGSTKIRRACEEIPTGTGPGLQPCAGSPLFAPLLLHTLSPEDPRVTILQGQAPSDSGTPEHAATKSPRPCTPVPPRAGDIQPLGRPCPRSPDTELALGTCSRPVPSRFDHRGKQHALLWCFKGHHVHLFPAESSVVNSAEKSQVYF